MEKKEWICLPYSPLSETKQSRSRYEKTEVQSCKNKCEDIDFPLILGEGKCLLDVIKREVNHIKTFKNFLLDENRPKKI